ncbi:MAG: hypothetical protein DME55_09765 [Verrucomicrobia bacterium]|nr:MAG: hypothetical protein DME55_09765 [Verrucomicrobiota bacterium]
MAGTESLRQVAHARASWSVWFGIVLLFALFGVIVLAIIGPAPRGSDYEEARAKKRVENLKTVREEADKALTTYGWIDKNKGLARIPVERAMELTVAELAKQKPAPAGPIATPEAPATASAPASTTSPAPASSKPSGAQTSPQAVAPAAPQGAAVSSGAVAPAKAASPQPSPAAQASASPAASQPPTSPSPAKSP